VFLYILTHIYTHDTAHTHTYTPVSSRKVERHPTPRDDADVRRQALVEELWVVEFARVVVVGGRGGVGLGLQDWHFVLEVDAWVPIQQ
jgi:hypothetical protein